MMRTSSRGGGERIPFALGLLSALMAAPYAVFWAVQIVTLTGGDRFVMVTTLVGFAILGPLWSALSVASIIWARRIPATRRRRASIPAAIALLATGVCSILAVLTLFT